VTDKTLLFRSELDLPQGSEDADGGLSDLRAEGWAEFLADRLTGEGLAPLSDRPYRSEGGWSLDVAANAAAFTLTVGSRSPAERGSEFWVVRIRPRLGPLFRLLGPAVPAAGIDLLREALERIVRMRDPATEIRWSNGGENGGENGSEVHESA
jgi:hypothetical protein